MKPLPDVARSEAAMRRLLGVEPDADLGEIKAAFRRRIKLLHPDHSRIGCSSQTISRLIDAYSGLSAIYRTGKCSEGDAAIQGSGSSCSLTDVFALGELAMSSTDAAVRVCAIQSLAASGKRSSFSFLRRLLDDPEVAVAEAAIRAIARLGIRQAEGELAARYSRSPLSIRKAILDAVAVIGTGAGSSALLNCAAQDSDHLLQQQAEELLNRFRTADSAAGGMRRMA